MKMQYGRDALEEITEASKPELWREVLAEMAKEQVRVVEEEVDWGAPELQGMRISLPESRSVLRIGPQGPDMEVMRIESPYPYPGALRRLAYWLILGWKWERP